MSITVKAASSTFTFRKLDGGDCHVGIITGYHSKQRVVFVFSPDKVRELIDAFSSLLPPSTIEPLYVVSGSGHGISSLHRSEWEAVEYATKESATSCAAVHVYKRVASIRTTKIETYKTEVER